MCRDKWQTAGSFLFDFSRLTPFCRSWSSPIISVVSLRFSVPYTIAYGVCFHFFRVSSEFDPQREAVGFLMSPPCLESQGCQFDPTFLYPLSCSSAKSCRSVCLILFWFWPILLTSVSLNLHFPKSRLFCVALVFFVFV